MRAPIRLGRLYTIATSSREQIVCRRFHRLLLLCYLMKRLHACQAFGLGFVWHRLHALLIPALIMELEGSVVAILLVRGRSWRSSQELRVLLTTSVSFVP